MKRLLLVSCLLSVLVAVPKLFAVDSDVEYVNCAIACGGIDDTAGEIEDPQAEACFQDCLESNELA